jgi:hypothetical protein
MTRVNLGHREKLTLLSAGSDASTVTASLPDLHGGRVNWPYWSIREMWLGLSVELYHRIMFSKPIPYNEHLYLEGSGFGPLSTCKCQIKTCSYIIYVLLYLLLNCTL